MNSVSELPGQGRPEPYVHGFDGYGPPNLECGFRIAEFFTHPYSHCRSLLQFYRAPCEPIYGPFCIFVAPFLPSPFRFFISFFIRTALGEVSTILFFPAAWPECAQSLPPDPFHRAGPSGTPRPSPCSEALQASTEPRPRLFGHRE